LIQLETNLPSQPVDKTQHSLSDSTLAPLDTKMKSLTNPWSMSSVDDSRPEKKADVHVPAVNIAAVKKTEQLREKMALIKEKRRINKMLG